MTLPVMVEGVPSLRKQELTTRILPSGKGVYSAVVPEAHCRWNQFGLRATSYHFPEYF